MLHPGHIRLLEQARALGDVLVVGVRGDAAARAMRGGASGRDKAPLRPILPASERAEILAGFAAVELVVIFESREPEELLVQLQPDVIVKGAPQIAVASVTKSVSGGAESIVCIPREPGYSSTRLIERIQQLRA